MNRLGIVVDVSHASDQTTLDTIRASTKPIVASHSNARALRDHLRNLTDEMITAIANGGGVIGAVAVSHFVADGDVTVADWADHVDYLVNLAGIDHVGIGCDFFHDLNEIGSVQGIPAWGADTNTTSYVINGMAGWRDLPGLTAELRRRGYDEASLTKI
jgi:membrane dipeptidase